MRVSPFSCMISYGCDGCSGPRCGLGELNLPENEPGSSIMPVLLTLLSSHCSPATR
jgi:hypothetical protein